MKSYQVVFFDSSGARGTRTIVLPGLLFFIIIFLVLVVSAAFIITSLLTLNLKREIYALRGSDAIYTAEKSTMKNTTDRIEKDLIILQRGNAFVQDIFKAPVVAAAFNYNDFSEGYRADSLREQVRIDNKRSYRSIPNMMKVMDAMNAESEKRLEQYNKLYDYLEEQEIIFAHTPSIWPCTERTTSGFGFRRSPFTGVPTFHEGTDFGAFTGTVVKSTADGVVVFAGTRSGYGYLVTIDHGFGYMTRYAHNSKLLVKPGDFVKKGSTISLSGSTGRSSGAHLHYEVLYNGCPVNAAKFLPKNTD